MAEGALKPSPIGLGQAAFALVHPGSAARERGSMVDHELAPEHDDANERTARVDRAAAHTRSLRGSLQDDTSDSQLIARCRSRARSPMSIPVAVAT